MSLDPQAIAAALIARQEVPPEIDRIWQITQGDPGKAAIPQVPADPTPQDIVDALVALGLVTQEP